MAHDCHTFQKDPLDKRKMSIDFEDWLGGAGIAAASWTVPSGITEASSSFTTSVAVNYFSGGTEGQSYEIACTITTDDPVPRLKTQRFVVEVEKDC